MRRRDPQTGRGRGGSGARGGAGKEGHGGPEGDPAAGVGADRRGCALPFSAGAGSDRSGHPQDSPEPRQHQRPRPGEGCHPGVQGEKDPHPHRRQRRLHRRAQRQAEAHERTGRRLLRQQARPFPGHHDHQAGRISGHLPRGGFPRHRHQRQEHRSAAGDRCLQGDQQAVRLPAAPGRDARRARRKPGTIRSVVPLGHLLASGIGDTIRISYANDPIYEVQDGLELCTSWACGRASARS